METRTKWVIASSAVLLLSSLPLALIFGPVNPQEGKFWLVMSPCLYGAIQLIGYVLYIAIKSSATRAPTAQELSQQSMRQNLETMKWYEDMRYLQQKPWKDGK